MILIVILTFSESCKLRKQWIYYHFSREGSAISLKDKHFESEFEVTHRAAGSCRYADSGQKNLLNSGPIAWLK